MHSKPTLKYPSSCITSARASAYPNNQPAVSNTPRTVSERAFSAFRRGVDGGHCSCYLPIEGSSNEQPRRMIRLLGILGPVVCEVHGPQGGILRKVFSRQDSCCSRSLMGTGSEVQLCVGAYESGFGARTKGVSTEGATSIYPRPDARLTDHQHFISPIAH